MWAYVCHEPVCRTGAALHQLLQTAFDVNFLHNIKQNVGQHTEDWQLNLYLDTKRNKKKKKNLPKIFSVFLWSLIFQFVVLSDESYDVWENMNWILARHGGKAENTSAPSDAIQHSLQGLWEFITFLGGMSQKQRKREDLRLTALVSFSGTAHCHKALWVS